VGPDHARFQSSTRNALQKQKKIALICSSEQDSEAGAAKASDSSHLLLDSMFDFAGGGRTNTDFQGAASTFENVGSYSEGIMLCIWRQRFIGLTY
ncbi:hypothetical protein LINGRAHAP2_LOCUS4417, partial [Linum grandiflorum]